MAISNLRKKAEAAIFIGFSSNEEHSEHPYVSVEYWKEYKSNKDKLKVLDEIGEKEYQEMKNKYTLKVNLKLSTYTFLDEVRIVVIGNTGVGKSTTANTILGKHLFIETASSASVTCKSRRRENKVNGRLIKVIDTPGLHDTHKSKEEITQEIARVMKLFADGIHAFIYVQDISNPRFKQENKGTLESIENMFGGGIKNFRLLVYSKADILSPTSSLDKFRDAQMGDASQAIAHFLKDLDWKVVAVNNKTTIPAEKKRNHEVVIAMVDKLRQQNDNAVYTNEMFEEAVKKRKELEEKGNTMGWNPAVMTAVDAVIAADPDVVKDTEKLSESIQNYFKGKIEETERELAEARETERELAEAIRRREEEEELRIAEQRDRESVLREDIKQEHERQRIEWQKWQEEQERRYGEEKITMKQEWIRREQEWVQRQKQQDMEWQQALKREREKRRRMEQDKETKREAKTKHEREKMEQELEKWNEKARKEKLKREEEREQRAKLERELEEAKMIEKGRLEQTARMHAAQIAEGVQKIQQAELERQELESKERQRREQIDRDGQERIKAEMEKASLRGPSQEELLAEERERARQEKEQLIAENVKKLQKFREVLNNANTEREAREIAKEHEGILNAMVDVAMRGWTKFKNLIT